MPSASGTLARTPLVHLLLYALDKKLAGTMDFSGAGASQGRAASVLFVAGRPAKVRTSDPVAYLGRTLVEIGLLDETRHARSLAELAEAKAVGPALHGQILLAARHIDEAGLLAGLQEQLERKLRLVAAFAPESSYEYRAGYDGLRTWGLDTAYGFDPLPMAWRLLRDSPPRAHVDAALERIVASPLRLSRAAQLQRLSLERDELAAAELLRVRPMRFEELATASGLGAEDTRLLAYLLLMTKQVDVMRAESSASRPPAARTSDAAVARASDAAVARTGDASAPRAGDASAPRAGDAGGFRAEPGTSRGFDGPLTMRSREPSRTSEDTGSPAPPTASQLFSGPQFSPPPTRTPVPARESMRPGPRISAPPARLSSPRPPPPEPPTRPAFPTPPTTLTPEQQQRWGEIVDRATTIDRADYFSMLDVARDATHDEIEGAFLNLAKRWHPDRLSPELAPLREACSRVFARMSEAHATLVDDAERANYMRLLADGSGSPAMQETVAKVIEAATNFQKAEVCFRRNDLAQAESFVRKALESDPTQPDYHALLAWLIALKPENQSPEKTRVSIHMLDRAVEMSDRCEKAFFWRGMLNKRLGKAEQAIRDFKRAVSLNPRNIDAAREVRLYHMRGGRPTSHPPSTAPAVPTAKGGSDPPRPDETKPGIFGRLFKKP